jgi:hypothetical protein
MPKVAYPSTGVIEKLGVAKREFPLWSRSSFDHDLWEDSFKGDLLQDEYPAAKTNGTSAAVTFTEHNANGFLELVSGTSDNGYGGQGVGLNWTGDRGVLVEAIVQLPAAITTMKVEFGVSDADDDAGAVNVKVTPSSTAADYAVFILDTDDDANWAFISAKAGTETETQDIVAAAVNTTYRLSVRVTGDNVIAYINGAVVAEHGNGIEGGSGLTPWAFCQARTGSASRTLKLHKWCAQQPAY